MNSIRSIPQAAPNPNPIQAAAPAAADQTDRSNSQDFAGAMNAAGSKPARKPTARQHDSAPSGIGLPVAGNQPPPNAGATAGGPATGQAATAVVSGNAGSGAAASAQAAGPAAGSAATPANPSNAPAASPEPVATPPLTSAAAEELAGANSPTAVDLRNLPPAPDSAIADTAATMPHASSIQTPPTAAAAQSALPSAAPSASPPPPGAAAPPAFPIGDGKASKAEIAAATSAPTATTVNAAQNAQAQASAPSAADNDATTQAIMAAAVAQGTSAPSPDSSASSDNLATPDTGVTLQGVSAADDVAATLPTGLPVHSTTAATSASVTAATAAAVVQAVSASADSGPTDKHSHDNSPDGSIGAAQLLTSNAPSDTATNPTPTYKVAAGVDTADFGRGVADRVSLMMDGNLTSARLQVNPPALGPIEVRIALQGGHAQVWMSSHSAVTRDALESTSPKLREMLGTQGFAQVSVDISQRSFQDRTPQPKGYESMSAIGSSPAAPAHVSVAAARSASGLLDAYA
jgi:flagellar hook-length control protein FliK